MLRDNKQDLAHRNNWSFIGGMKGKNESFQEAILRKIKEETSLELVSVEFVTTLNDTDEEKYIFHATLTADNINNIHRGERQNLDFFTLQEVEKLSLATGVKFFLQNNKDTIERMLHS